MAASTVSTHKPSRLPQEVIIRILESSETPDPRESEASDLITRLILQRERMTVLVNCLSTSLSWSKAAHHVLAKIIVITSDIAGLNLAENLQDQLINQPTQLVINYGFHGNAILNIDSAILKNISQQLKQVLDFTLINAYLQNPSDYLFLSGFQCMFLKLTSLQSKPDSMVT